MKIFIVLTFLVSLATCRMFGDEFGPGIQDSLLFNLIGGQDSPKRDFYIRLHIHMVKKDIVSTEYDSFKCGGAIINESWVLTAASCVAGSVVSQIDRIDVEVRDFSDETSQGQFISTLQTLVHAGYRRNDKLNNLALLQLSAPVSSDRVLQPCQYNAHFHKLLGTCGMGTMSSLKDDDYPTRLREGFFDETNYGCRRDNICTKRLFKGTKYGANICEGDFGSPLYTLHDSETSVPECVYGIASYSGDSLRATSKCTGGSFFTNVPLFYDWIRFTIERYSSDVDY